MGDRLDIDALLIGSLYGELNAADEVRLQTHLESHPGDRAALAGLTRARELLHASHYMKLQLEPPQAISALLLQQAAQHAPKVKAVAVETEREGWFARFVRTFVGHPAMAAATMLVLVLGVAGVMYMRKGNQFAEPSVSRTPPPSTESLGGEGKKQQPLQQEKLDSYKAELATNDPAPAGADGKDKDREDKKHGGGSATASPDHMVPSQRVLEAKTSPGPAPKELDDEKGEKVNNEKPPADQVAKTEVKRPEAPAMPATPRSQPLATPDTDTLALEKVRTRGITPGNAPTTTPPRTGLTVSPPPSSSAGSGSATIARSEEQTTETLAWAKQQHQRLVTETQRNQCEAAGATAVALSLRAPGYYQQNVETDRTLKQCAAYINRAREVDEARTRAARKRLEEAPAPAPAKAAAPAADSKR